MSQQPGRHPRWRWAGRIAGLLLLALLAVLLVRQARRIDWPAVGHAVAAMPAGVLAAAAALAAVAHALYAGFDLLGRRYVGHALPARQVMLVGFTSYAINLNLGSLLGGVACRARLYHRLGLGASAIARIVLLSMLSNWIGYLALAGAVFFLRPPALPPSWELDSQGLRWVGAALVAVVTFYLGLCARHGGQILTLRGQPLALPRAWLALSQVGLSVLHWGAMAALLATLFQGRVPYLLVLAVLLIAAIAGVLTHVPAGLGVLEAVFVALLAHRVPTHLLLAGLVMYRALFYLLPLAAAAVVYVRLESRPRAAPLRPRETAPAPGRRARPPAHRSR